MLSLTEIRNICRLSRCSSGTERRSGPTGVGDVLIFVSGDWPLPKTLQNTEKT